MFIAKQLYFYFMMTYENKTYVSFKSFKYKNAINITIKFIKPIYRKLENIIAKTKISRSILRQNTAHEQFSMNIQKT